MIRDTSRPFRYRTHRYLPIIAVVALLVVASPALARGKKGGSIELTESNPYTIGQQVSFDVTTTNIDQPWVTTRCYQDGEIVYAESHSPDGVFTLGPTSKWHSGGADCTATLFWLHRQKQRVVDTIGFVVSE